MAALSDGRAGLPEVVQLAADKKKLQKEVERLRDSHDQQGRDLLFWKTEVERLREALLAEGIDPQHYAALEEEA